METQWVGVIAIFSNTKQFVIAIFSKTKAYAIAIYSIKITDISLLILVTTRCI